MAASNDRGQLITALHEPVKRYLVYDGSNRLTDMYEARANAADGDVCMRTQYTYVGVTYFTQKILETISNWDSAWDIT